MHKEFNDNIQKIVDVLKKAGYYYKDGKIFNKKGVVASYPVLKAKTDAVRICFTDDSGLEKCLEAPLEMIVLKWHDKELRADQYPTCVDGDIANTRVENLVYTKEGEKAEDLKFEERSQEELRSTLSLMGIHPDPPAKEFNAAKILSDISLYKKDREAFPEAAPLSLYESFVLSRMNKKLDTVDSLTNYSMGLAGESGELVNILKKHVFHGHALDVSEFVDELGDCLFYLQALCTCVGVRLEEVILHNARKLSVRYPEKFTETDSMVRKDVNEKGN